MVSARRISIRRGDRVVGRIMRKVREGAWVTYWGTRYVIWIGINWSLSIDLNDPLGNKETA